MALISPVIINASVELYMTVVSKVFSMQFEISFFKFSLDVELTRVFLRLSRNSETNLVGFGATSKDLFS